MLGRGDHLKCAQTGPLLYAPLRCARSTTGRYKRRCDAGSGSGGLVDSAVGVADAGISVATPVGVAATGVVVPVGDVLVGVAAMGVVVLVGDVFVGVAATGVVVLVGDVVGVAETAAFVAVPVGVWDVTGLPDPPGTDTRAARQVSAQTSTPELLLVLPASATASWPRRGVPSGPSAREPR